jgi:hypothetical protein
MTGKVPCMTKIVEPEPLEENQPIKKGKSS